MESFKDLRRRQSLSQAELSKRAGVRQATISAIEKATSQPHRATRQKLAEALGCSLESIERALQQTLSEARPKEANVIQSASEDWPFLRGLDTDLRRGLSEALVSDWTHHSTGLEGNTISAGDTLFVLQEGLTISGKSLREHQEIHGHAQALSILTRWLTHGGGISELHDLHRAVQSGSTPDIFSPVGQWKNEDNGTMVITTNGERVWHNYSRPYTVSSLMKRWMESFLRQLKEVGTEEKSLAKVFTDVHLGFTAIHPYADGNGRLARLLANLPLLKAGFPPLIVQSSARKEYITLLGDYTLTRSTPTPDDEHLVLYGQEREALVDFFHAQWKYTLQMVEQFHERQIRRG